MDVTNLQLIGAREAARILCVDPKTIYKLWNSEKLDFWCINGTMKTNREAIMAFLDRTRNEKMTILPQE